MPSIERFKESLSLFKIDENVIAQINEGCTDVDNKASKKVRGAYFKRAVDIMTAQVSTEKLIEVFEWNACCKGGMREKTSKAFAKENAHLSIDERLEKIKYVPNMGSPIRNEDGTITVNAVSYWRDGQFSCACSNYNGLNVDYKISKNYCFCCAGHFKHHYEIMLGVELKTLEIISSPLDSDGKNPCIIKFAIVR